MLRYIDLKMAFEFFSLTYVVNLFLGIVKGISITLNNFAHI